jgi:hypothetical protein
MAMIISELRKFWIMMLEIRIDLVTKITARHEKKKKKKKSLMEFDDYIYPYYKN